MAYNSNAQFEPVGNQGDAKTRDKNLSTNTWENPQTVFANPAGQSMAEKIFADNSYVFDFYNKFVGSGGLFYSQLYVKKRGVSSTTWSSATLRQQSSNVTYLPSLVKSTDGKVHIVYGGSSNAIYRNYNGSSWSSETTIGDGNVSPSMSGVSNDLYVVYQKGSNDDIKYRQYDADPLAPQNLQVGPNPGNNRVRLTWDANIEPDLSLYAVSRKMSISGQGGTWSEIGTTSNLYFVDNDMQYSQHYNA